MIDKKTTKLPTTDQISAGGVAFRKTASGAEIAIISVNPSRRWQLPKGLVEEGERLECAARREAREEAGIETELLELIEELSYWYVGEHRGERVRFHKFVYFYLLKYVSGETANHDWEVVEARWVKRDKAMKMLAFRGERDVVKKAFEIINKIH